MNEKKIERILFENRKKGENPPSSLTWKKERRKGRGKSPLGLASETPRKKGGDLHLSRAKMLVKKRGGL